MNQHREHILLIGIDAYEKVDPLYGAVNDIDSLEAVFLDRLVVSPESILKLTAPHPRTSRRTRSREERATSENIRRALRRLGEEVVSPGDRVFVHYSGHGTQVMPRGARFVREALVPVDVLSGGSLLFDEEINELLLGIALRTDDLTVVLDCCCSAGATRSLTRPSDGVVRCCHLAEDGFASDLPKESSSGLLSSFDPSDPGFLVVASSQSSEPSHEGRDSMGVRHGALTRAFLDILRCDSDERLKTLRWVDIWQALRVAVIAAFPGQHPCLLGRRERGVFGGPFRKQDPGFPIVEVSSKVHIHAGTLVGLGPGAKVAVYGSFPDEFSPLYSPEDLENRRGLLLVERATASFSIATKIGKLKQVAGLRGRLVTPGPAERLCLALDPFDEELASWLSREAPVHVIPLHAAFEREPEAILGVTPHGDMWIGDELFGPSGEEPLLWVNARDRAALLRGIWHYIFYNLPLRLARLAREWPRVLRLRVLDASHASELMPEEHHDPAFAPVALDPACPSRYRVVDGQPVCFTIENRSSRPWYTQIINCSASGRVEVLGATQLEIAPWKRQAIWLRGHLGKPFPCRVSRGRESNVERLLVVGTASPDVDLGYLRVKESFEEAASTTRRDMPRDAEEPCGTWTASMTQVKIVRVMGSS